MSIFAFINILWCIVFRPHDSVVFRDRIVYSDCRIGGRPVKMVLMEDGAVWSRGRLVAVCCWAMNRRVKCLLERRVRQSGRIVPTNNSDQRSGLALLRKMRIWPLMAAGWICARRAFAVSWTPVSGLRAAQHPIDDVMSYQQATKCSPGPPITRASVSFLCHLQPETIGLTYPTWPGSWLTPVCCSLKREVSDEPGTD